MRLLKHCWLLLGSNSHSTVHPRLHYQLSTIANTPLLENISTISLQHYFQMAQKYRQQFVHLDLLDEFPKCLQSVCQFKQLQMLRNISEMISGDRQLTQLSKNDVQQLLAILLYNSTGKTKVKMPTKFKQKLKKMVNNKVTISNVQSYCMLLNYLAVTGQFRFQIKQIVKKLIFLFNFGKNSKIISYDKFTTITKLLQLRQQSKYQLYLTSLSKQIQKIANQYQIQSIKPWFHSKVIIQSNYQKIQITPTIIAHYCSMLSAKLNQKYSITMKEMQFLIYLANRYQTDVKLSKLLYRIICVIIEEQGLVDGYLLNNPYFRKNIYKIINHSRQAYLLFYRMAILSYDLKNILNFEAIDPYKLEDSYLCILSVILHRQFSFMHNQETFTKLLNKVDSIVGGWFKNTHKFVQICEINRNALAEGFSSKFNKIYIAQFNKIQSPFQLDGPFRSVVYKIQYLKYLLSVSTDLQYLKKIFFEMDLAFVQEFLKKEVTSNSHICEQYMEIIRLMHFKFYTFYKDQNVVCLKIILQLILNYKQHLKIKEKKNHKIWKILYFSLKYMKQFQLLGLKQQIYRNIQAFICLSLPTQRNQQFYIKCLTTLLNKIDIIDHKTFMFTQLVERWLERGMLTTQHIQKLPKAQLQLTNLNQLKFDSIQSQYIMRRDQLNSQTVEVLVAYAHNMPFICEYLPDILKIINTQSSNTLLINYLNAYRLPNTKQSNSILLVILNKIKIFSDNISLLDYSSIFKFCIKNGYFSMFEYRQFAESILLVLNQNVSLLMDIDKHLYLIKYLAYQPLNLINYRYMSSFINNLKNIANKLNVDSKTNKALILWFNILTIVKKPFELEQINCINSHINIKNATEVDPFIFHFYLLLEDRSRIKIKRYENHPLIDNIKAKIQNHSKKIMFDLDYYYYKKKYQFTAIQLSQSQLLPLHFTAGHPPIYRRLIREISKVLECKWKIENVINQRNAVIRFKNYGFVFLGPQYNAFKIFQHYLCKAIPVILNEPELSVIIINYYDELIYEDKMINTIANWGLLTSLQLQILRDIVKNVKYSDNQKQIQDLNSKQFSNWPKFEESSTTQDLIISNQEYQESITGSRQIDQKQQRQQPKTD